MTDDAMSGAEQVPAAVRLAHEIQRRRKAANLSQPQLADRIGYTRQYVSLAERPGKNLPSQELVRALDSALEAAGVLLRLREEAKAEQQLRRRVLTNESADVEDARRDDAVRAAIPALRRVLAATDLPEDGPVRTLNVLNRAVGMLVEQRLEARYGQMAAQLPDLLAELLRAQQTMKPAHQREIARLLTAAYRAADGLAFKFGYTDLSAWLIDLMRATAMEADDPLLLASVAYVRTETFFATGDLDTAVRALVLAVDHMPRTAFTDSSWAATYGSLHMRAAVVAARAGRPEQANDHLSQARMAAARVPEGVYYGTAFGPSSVKIHDVAVAVELGDSPTAVELGGSWHPPRVLPAERRSHYYIDLARAQLEIGRLDDAYGALRTARQVAPQHIRAHPQVRRALTTLVRTPLGRNQEVLNYATWLRLTSR